MDPRKLLKQGAGELDIDVSEAQVSSFMTFLSELRKWNRAYNLTSLKTDEDIVVKHFLDSLLYVNLLSPDMTRIADAGSGAGFPGIAMKIVRSGLDMSLIESSRKKTAFLRHMVRKLELHDITVIEQRIEKLGEGDHQRYDAIVSRATFGVREFRTIACPFLKPEGRLILSKGPRYEDELDREQVDKRAVEKVARFTLPFSGALRNLLVITC